MELASACHKTKHGAGQPPDFVKRRFSIPGKSGIFKLYCELSGQACDWRTASRKLHVQLPQIVALIPGILDASQNSVAYFLQRATAL